MPKLYTVELKGGAHGQLEAGHLADHPAAVAAMQGVLRAGSPLGPLLVLERLEVMLLLHCLCVASVSQSVTCRVLGATGADCPVIRIEVKGSVVIPEQFAKWCTRYCCVLSYWERPEVTIASALPKSRQGHLKDTPLLPGYIKIRPSCLLCMLCMTSFSCVLHSTHATGVLDLTRKHLVHHACHV